MKTNNLLDRRSFISRAVIATAATGFWVGQTALGQEQREHLLLPELEERLGRHLGKGRNVPSGRNTPSVTSA